MDLIRVMLADDHPAFREGIRAQIERENDMVVIQEADNGKDAIELAAQLVPDVMVLDMELPLYSGLEVARELQARSIPTLILPLSGFSSPEYVIGVLESGAPGYITKDESLKDIIAAIRKIMKGGVYISPRVTIQIVNQERRKVRNSTEVERSQQQLEELGITEILLRVLKLVALGHTNLQIAEVVHRSEHTVRNQVDKLKNIVGVQWRPSLVAWAWKNEIMQMSTEDDPPGNGEMTLVDRRSFSA